MELMIVLSTFPDAEAARKAARVLVEERLAACVNLCPGVESLYHWGGKLETSQEVLAVIKTTAARFEALRRRLHELHPYEVPEILGLPVSGALEAYAAWIFSSTAPGGA